MKEDTELDPTSREALEGREDAGRSRTQSDRTHNRAARFGVVFIKNREVLRDVHPDFLGRRSTPRRSPRIRNSLRCSSPHLPLGPCPSPHAAGHLATAHAGTCRLPKRAPPPLDHRAPLPLAHATAGPSPAANHRAAVDSPAGSRPGPKPPRAYTQPRPRLTCPGPALPAHCPEFPFGQAASTHARHCPSRRRPWLPSGCPTRAHAPPSLGLPLAPPKSHQPEPNRITFPLTGPKPAPNRKSSSDRSETGRQPDDVNLMTTENL
nr:uncharacterized protein LOC127303852 [Lolium perenne]